MNLACAESPDEEHSKAVQVSCPLSVHAAMHEQNDSKIQGKRSVLSTCFRLMSARSSESNLDDGCKSSKKEACFY